MPTNMTITDLSAIDANGLRTVTGVVNGVTRQVSLPIAELEPLTFEEATARFIERFRLQLASDPKPYPLPFSSFTIEP
jgi:hypothetical protein